nr:carbohydrate ABC transporter permease [Jiangella endophytica]
MILGAVVMFYPLAWMISSSVKPEEQIFTTATELIPRSLTAEHYVDGWNAGSTPFPQLLLNSFIISSLVAIGTVISCSVTAYAFARLRFPLRRFWFALMIVTIMLPAHVTLVPKYILFSELGWVDTYLPLIVPTFLATDAFFVFLLHQFIRTIPLALDEAARIDGCNPLRTFWHITLPLLRPALATTAIFSFIWSYGDFFSQLIYISNPKLFTVALGLQQFLDSHGGSQYGSMLAMSVLSLIPVVALFVFFQRQLVDGIATSGLR